MAGPTLSGNPRLLLSHEEANLRHCCHVLPQAFIQMYQEKLIGTTRAALLLQLREGGGRQQVSRTRTLGTERETKKEKTGQGVGGLFLCVSSGDKVGTAGVHERQSKPLDIEENNGE